MELSLILEPLRSVCDGSRPLCIPPSIIPYTMHVASSRSVGLQDSSWCIMRGGVGTSREVRFAGLWKQGFGNWRERKVRLTFCIRARQTFMFFEHKYSNPRYLKIDYAFRLAIHCFERSSRMILIVMNSQMESNSRAWL